MGERKREWYELDVPRVMQEADDLYARVVAIDPNKSKANLTKSKIIEAREWAPTLRMYEKNFDKVIKQLGFFYVPKQVLPGPAFVFPIRDLGGQWTSAQTRPLEGSALTIPGMKYRYIGDKNILGPRWLGNDRETLKRIIDTKKVVIVEGPFDVLAARLLCPDLPIMSPLTKMLGKHHQAYLRMLGVNNLLLMYDNDVAKGDDKEGAGNMSMAQQAATIKTMKVSILTCPKSDPSACLKYQDYAEKLRSRLRLDFQY
jgi:hypothetical protein